MKTKGVTVVELVITISIIAIISALLFPVVSAAVSRAKERTCGENLRQFSMALSMYRANHDGDGRFGTPAEMGMPGSPVTLLYQGYVKRGLEKCGGVDPRGATALYTIFWGGFDNQEWAKYTLTWGNETISDFDINHRNRFGTYHSPLAIHFAFGTNLEGRLIHKTKRGFPDEQAWWHE